MGESLDLQENTQKVTFLRYSVMDCSPESQFSNANPACKAVSPTIVMLQKHSSHWETPKRVESDTENIQ